MLLHLVRHRCRGRWRRTTLPRYQQRGIEVKIGELLADGRWYVDVIKGDGDECRPVGDEQAARRVATAWMRHLGGEWEQVPCDPTAAAIPEARRRAQERAQPPTDPQA